MKQSNPRRRFLQQAGLASMAISLLPEETEAQPKPTTKKRYTGEGQDLDAALQQAVNRAVRDIRVPDGAVAWKLVEVSGRAGGLAGIRTFKVIIGL